MAQTNILVDWLNKNKKNIAQGALNTIKNVQNVVNNSSATNPTNATPNLPTVTSSTVTPNYKRVQEPVQTKLNNLNDQTKPTVAMMNGQPMTETSLQSRFIGFQQPKYQTSTIGTLDTTPQATSFKRLLNGGYTYIPSAINQAQSSNYKEENRYKTQADALEALQSDIYYQKRSLTRNEISENYPEFKDNIDVVMELQDELTPIILDQGMYVSDEQISQKYPELLKGKELKDVEDIKKKSELSNKNFQQLDKTISKALKTDWELYSTNGLKYIQNAKKITDAVKIAKQQGIVGGANDFEIARELAKSNPELQQAIKEMNRLELTESDKVRLGKSGNLLVAAREGLQTGIWNDIFGESETPISDEELDSAIRARDKLENDFWRQTGKKIATEIGVPLDSLEKFTYRTYKDIQNKILETGMEYTKDYAKKQIKSAFKEGLGVELTDEQLNSIDNVYNTAVAPSINEQIKTNQQNVMDYIESVNKEYESRKRRNLDTDVENYVNNRSMTQSLLAGDLSSFAYKAAGETAQNAEMPLIIAAGVVAPEVVLPLMAVDSYSRENQEAFEELTKAGANYEQAQEGAAIVGLASSAVELTLEKLLGGVETTASKTIKDIITKDFTKKATEMVAEKGLVELLKNGAVTQFRSSFEEGLEEVLQQVIHNTAIQKYDPNQEITQGLWESFEGGFFNPMNLLAGGGEVYGGIKENSETIKQNAYETAYNLGQKTRQVTDKVDNALNKGAYNVGKGVRNLTDLKNKVTSQGRTGISTNQQQAEGVNTTSENQNNINGDNYNQKNKNSKSLNQAQLGLLKSYNKMNPVKITEFQDKFGKDYGQAMADMGYTESRETNVPKMEEDIKEIYNEKKKAMNSVEGEFQDRSLADMLEIMLQKARNTKDYDMIDKYEKLTQKHNEKGLTMAEANDMREEFSYKIKTKWGGDGNSDKIDLADNVYTAVRKFLETTAEKNGIKDLQKMNRDIAMRKYLSTRIGDKAERQSANNMMSINDWIMFAEAATNPQAMALFAGKKVLEQTPVKNAVLNAVVGRRENRAIDQQNRQAANKERMENIESANEGKRLQQELSIPETPALPNGIKLTKVTEIDARKPKNKVTKKNNNKKSDSSSSDDTTSGGTPTGGTPAGTNPTNNQGGTPTTDDTKTKKQPKKKAETKTKATSKKSAVTDYINETPQNERGQMEEIEAEENLRNNETPQRDMVEETPKNKVTAKKTEATTPKQEENQTKHFDYKDYGEFMKKYETAEKEINDRLDKQMDKERAEKMERFNELTKKEDKTDAEGKEMMKLAGELNNMPNKYDRLKEQEFNKKHPELVAEKQRQNEMFDRDWKAAMDKKMEEINKPFNNLRDKYLKELRDELGIADDVTLDSDFYNSLTPEQKKIADEINKEYAEKYEELRQKTASIKKIEEETKTKITKNKKNKVTNPSKVKESGLFNENDVDKGNKSEGLNPDALPLSDYREMQRLNDGYSLTSLSSALSKESLKDYMANKIANEKIGVKPDFDDNEAWDKLPEDFEDDWETVASDIEDMYDAYEEYLDMKNGGDTFDENILKNTLESANDYANRQFPGKTAKEVIDQYTPQYEADLKIYNRLKEKYPGFTNGKIDLTGAEGKARREFASQENETAQDIDYQELAERENETPQVEDEELNTSPLDLEFESERRTAEELDENETPQADEEEMNKVTKKQPEKPKNLVTSRIEANFMEEQAKSFDTPEAFIESAISKDYKVGDNVKGLGTIQDVTDTQVKINGQRFAKKILGDNIDNVTLSTIRSTLDNLQAKNKDISDVISARKKGLYLLSFIQNSKNKQHLADIGYLEPVGDSSGAEGFTTAKSHMRDYANLKHGVENAEKQLREYWESVNKGNSKDSVTSEQQSEFETLPDDVTVSQEAKLLGAKRIAPDRVPRQQLTFEEGVNKIAENLETLAEYKKARDEIYSPEGYNDGEVYIRYNNLKKEFQNIMYGNNGFQFKSNKSKEFTDLWKNIVDNKDNKTALREVAKNFYISKVKKDISKGYVYPQEVLDKIPGAKKAIDNRERYEKGLNTSFSAKDERIDYSEKDKIGAGMKSQDGKQITKEQKEDIVKGILDFGKTLGLDMKKFAEDRGLVYVHLHGGLAFLNNMAAGLYRESTNEQGEKNISVSVGGAENVRYKDPKTKERKTTTLNTTMSHELGHAMDYLLDNKLFSWTQKSILGSKYNPVNRLRKYYAKGNEIVARAIEQYVAVENGQPNYYLENGNLDAGEFKGTDLEYALKEVGSYYDRPGYWSKPDYEKYVKPYVEEAFKNNFEEYKINKSQKNVLGNDKNKVTTQAARAYSPTIVMRFDENGNPLRTAKNKVTSRKVEKNQTSFSAESRNKIGQAITKMRDNAQMGGLNVPRYTKNGPIENALNTIYKINSMKKKIRGQSYYENVLDGKEKGLIEIANVLDNGYKDEDINYKWFYDPLDEKHPTIIFWKGDDIKDSDKVWALHLEKNETTNPSINKFRNSRGRLEKTPLRSKKRGK